MGTSRSIKDLSRDNWTTTETSFEAIKLSALLRIAEATEKMAANYTQLQNDKEWYERQYRQQLEEIQHLRNSRAAYKAHLTRLRTKLTDQITYGVE